VSPARSRPSQAIALLVVRRRTSSEEELSTETEIARAAMPRFCPHLGTKQTSQCGGANSEATTRKLTLRSYETQINRLVLDVKLPKVQYPDT
jgi:hypothetical protein